MILKFKKKKKRIEKEKNTLISLSTLHPALPEATGSHRARCPLTWSTQGTTSHTTGQAEGGKSGAQTEDSEPVLKVFALNFLEGGI